MFYQVDYTKKVVKIHASEELASKLPITQITVKIQADLLVEDVIQQFKLKIEKANTKFVMLIMFLVLQVWQ